MKFNTDNPWKTLSSRIVYENAWIRLREDKVIRPDGKEGIYGVVEPRIATAVIAVDVSHNIYMVGQYRYPMDEYSWEIPQGGSDPEETALEAAKRELREEAGVLAGDWLQLGEEVHTSNCHSSERGILFVARDLTETDSEPEGTEILQIKKLPFAEALQMADSGEIKDALTIIGLYRAAKFFSGENS